MYNFFPDIIHSGESLSVKKAVKLPTQGLSAINRYCTCMYCISRAMQIIAICKNVVMYSLTSLRYSHFQDCNISPLTMFAWRNFKPSLEFRENVYKTPVIAPGTYTLGRSTIYLIDHCSTKWDLGTYFSLSLLLCVCKDSKFISSKIVFESEREWSPFPILVELWPLWGSDLIRRPLV